MTTFLRRISPAPAQSSAQSAPGYMPASGASKPGCGAGSVPAAGAPGQACQQLQQATASCKASAEGAGCRPAAAKGGQIDAHRLAQVAYSNDCVRKYAAAVAVAAQQHSEEMPWLQVAVVQAFDGSDMCPERGG